jgi:hypothetical protein
MEKNFMFPVLNGVMTGTVFAELPQLKVLSAPLPPSPENEFRDWDQVFKH